MGQNLSNGVYLPDEGERNCYSGLAANWNILNTAVGNIAGKASFSHTHGNITNDGKVGTTANLPLITGTGGAVQAGSFGNQANTFCEGNDSRLSDARTPVAHTHTKSDVTDLLNSNFIPSANNSYDLGSSSYQWNKIYGKEYYYNGTAWGLDKANVWTADQYIKSTTWEKGVEPSSASHKNIYFIDKNNLSVGTIRRRITNGGQSFQFYGSALVKNGQLDPTGDNINWGFSQVFNSDGSTYFQFDGNIGNSIVPRANNTYDLGSSTLKWKTINGINPGALSLPKAEYTDIDISAQGLNWDLTGGANTYTPTRDGWLEIWATRGSLASAYIDVDNTYIRNNTEVSVLNQAKLTIPVRNSQTYTVRILAEQCWVRIIKAEGNV